LESNRSYLRDNAPSIARAQAAVAKANLAGGWFDQGRTPVLDCLRFITEKFPQDPAIWVTGFTLHENGKATLQGRAASRDDVLRIYDHLMADKRFTDVNPLDIHDAGGSSRDVVFSLSFTYAAAGGGG